jgi:tetratricopeptide (TPR) repeat protein
MRGITSTVVTLFLVAGLIVSCGPSTKKADGLLESGDKEGAALLYRAAWEKKKDDKVALIKLARVLFDIHTESEKASGAQWQEVHELFVKATEGEAPPADVDPVKEWEVADSAWEAGKAYAQEGKDAEAVKMLQTARDKGKSGAKLSEQLSVCLEKIGDKQGAVDAALVAIEENTRDGKLLRANALTALELGRKADCHELMLIAEALEPAGFKFFTHKDIHQLVSRSYYYLTTGLLETVFTTRRLDNARVKDWKADEELMTKNWEKYQKRPPEEVKKEERSQFLRVLFHLYVAHGMAHVYLCEMDEARTWWQNADLIDKTRYNGPEGLSQTILDDELTWPSKNTALLDELTK